MKLRRIMIAAPKSGSGKTTVTCALLAALKHAGQQVVSYKCGPDYIDPMFHEKALGIPSKNLDTFFTGEDRTRELFLKGGTEQDFAVLEGVMGLFDGLGGIREEGSSYHLAEVTETPVILVIDAKGMGRSILPVIAGFLAYDTERLIRGVILNRMGEGYYERIRPLIEELKIRVLGYVPEQKEMRIESRHLGLVMPDELPGIQKRLQAVSEEFAKTVSLEGIMQIAGEAKELVTVHALSGGVRACPRDRDHGKPFEDRQVHRNRYEGKEGGGPVIGVAKDEAFCFYYTDNLRMLQEAGARIRFFSPLHDRCLPQECHALLLGGGYPEQYAEELSANVRMRETVRQAFLSGMPVVAECGGFLYLHSAITDQKGVRHAMAGVVPAVCSYTGRLVRFGYIEVKEHQSYFLPAGERIRGHEFHYFDSTDNGRDCTAVKPATGREYPCVIEGEHYWLGFPHLYYPSNPRFAQAFVEKAEKYRDRKEYS